MKKGALSPFFYVLIILFEDLHLALHTFYNIWCEY